MAEALAGPLELDHTYPKEHRAKRSAGEFLIRLEARAAPFALFTYRISCE
jgi:hypothetical protein